MKNVQIMDEGNTLAIKVDVSKEFGPSSSGKPSSLPRPKGASRSPTERKRSS